MSSIDSGDLTDTDDLLVRTTRATLDDEPDTLLDPEDVDRFMNAIKRTLLFQIEWQQLMSAGPKCLAKMGDCFLAVYTTSNPSLRLLDSPGSVPGLPHTSLISNVLHTSDTGVAAFNLAQQRMSEIYEISDEINTLLVEIIKCIRGPRNAVYLRILSTKLQALLGFATDSTQCAKKAHKAFSDWESLIGTLRRTIFDKQGAVPPPPPAPPAQPPLAIPWVPTSPAPEAEIIRHVRSARADDPIWAELPGLEASIRRLYGFVTYNADGIGFPGIVTSVDGGPYLTRLRYKFQEHQRRLASSRTTDIANTCAITTILTGILEHRGMVSTGTVAGTTTTRWVVWLLPHWGKVANIIWEATRLGFIPNDTNTWDVTDMIDRQYYRMSGIDPIPPVVPHLPGPQDPNPDLDGLVKCTDSLGEAKREVKKVIRFFNAISILGQNIVSVHVKNFKFTVDRLVRRGPTTVVNEEERDELIKHARSVKAYFCVIRAVALMYNHIHPTYIAEGIDLLVELSLSTSDEVRVRRQQSLARYSRTLSTELADYIEKKKRNILREIRSEVEEIVGGGSLRSRRLHDEDSEWDNTLSVD